MKTTTVLEDVKGAATLCIKCGNCTYGSWPLNYPLCPIYSRDRTYTHSAGGLLYLVLALLNGKMEFNQTVAELAFTCTGCLACDSQCGIIRSQSPNVDPWDIIRLLRYESVKRGFIPTGRDRKIHDELEKKGYYGEPGSFKLSSKIHSSKSNTVIFAECLHNVAQQEIANSVSRLLEKIGSPVTQFSGMGCCGSTLYDLGFWEKVEPLIKANWEKMQEIKEKTFIFINPHCQEFVFKRYPETMPESKNIRTRHISQLLVKALKNKKLKISRDDKITVSYHDPCYLGRGLGIYNAPREVLSLLDGVELVEMERNRENSFCCGARAVGSYFPEMTEWTAGERIKEFRATGADLLITACGYCQESFQKVLPEKDRKRVKDLTELVDERTR